MRRGATGSLRPPGDDPIASLSSSPRSRDQKSLTTRPPKYRRRARRKVTQGTRAAVIRPGEGENTSGGGLPRRGVWHASPIAYWHFGSPSLLAGASDVDPM